MEDPIDISYLSPIGAFKLVVNAPACAFFTIGQKIGYHDQPCALTKIEAMDNIFSNSGEFLYPSILKHILTAYNFEELSTIWFSEEDIDKIKKMLNQHIIPYIKKTNNYSVIFDWIKFSAKYKFIDMLQKLLSLYFEKSDMFMTLPINDILAEISTQGIQDPSNQIAFNLTYFKMVYYILLSHNNKLEKETDILQQNYVEWISGIGAYFSDNPNAKNIYQKYLELILIARLS